MHDLYIYYKVRDEHAAALALRVRAMQQVLAAERGVAGQLKRRLDANGGLQTWMEIYSAAPAGFDAALDVAVQDAVLAELIAGDRHTEIFTDLNTCA
ncbi:MAG: DUF4936 family protein [Telluria sp.]